MRRREKLGTGPPHLVQHPLQSIRMHEIVTVENGHPQPPLAAARPALRATLGPELASRAMTRTRSSVRAKSRAMAETSRSVGMHAVDEDNLDVAQ